MKHFRRRDKYFCLFVLLNFVFLNNANKREDEYKDFVDGMEELKLVAGNHTHKEENLDKKLMKDLEANKAEIVTKNGVLYDYIVIGAGSSGCVVAARLAKHWKILVLEAGLPENKYGLIPAMAGVIRNTHYNWGYTTESEENCCQGMIEKKCMVGGGKALGGSSAINQMLYTRGNKEDYNAWPKENPSDVGWTHMDIREYFRTAETHYLASMGAYAYGSHGPINIQEGYLSNNGSIYLAFKDNASNKYGGEVEFNGERDQMGFNRSQVNIKDGKRVSSAQAYLIPEKDNPNLTVKTSCRVLKIIIEDGAATGVIYLHEGKLYRVNAGKEVILSAGALNTPQLMMLSGLGPKEDLEALGINVIKDLQVGKNLKDHMMFLGMNFYTNETFEPIAEEDIQEYLDTKTGRLTSVDTDVIFFVKSQYEEDRYRRRPDVEMAAFINGFNEGYENLKDYRFTKDIYDSVWRPIEGKKMITLAFLLLNPAAIGEVKLKSKDPLNWPVIKLNCFDNERDLDILAEAAQVGLEWGKRFEKLGYKRNDHKVLGCETFELDSLEYLKCAVKYLSVSARHHYGTCRMGTDGVVDNRLRVHGIKNLRIVDASIIPVNISGHLHAPAVMIGERAADLIIKEHYQRQ